MRPAPTIRTATPDDIPAIRSILTAHGNDEPGAPVDIVGPYVAHLLAHHRAMVSESGGEIVAFGATVDAGVAVHLADLFVRPDLLGHGIGRPPLAAVFGDAPRRTTFASSDPRALPLYVRAGMLPLWACLYVEGASGALPPRRAGIETVAAAPDRLAALELAWTGVDRSIDHVFWASQAEADSFVVVDHGEPVAVAHARARQVSPVRAIDRLVLRPGADPVAPTLAALHRAGRGGAVVTLIMGPSPMLRLLLDLGFQVTEHDQYMASEPGLIDPARLLPNPGML